MYSKKQKNLIIVLIICFSLFLFGSHLSKVGYLPDWVYDLMSGLNMVTILLMLVVVLFRKKKNKHTKD